MIDVRVLLTDQGAAHARVRQMLSKDHQGHGKAEHQSDFKSAAFPTIKWQSKAPQIS